MLFVRYTLSNISNSTPVMTAPKTKTSHAWVRLSARVIDALEHQARRQASRHLQAGLVFCRPNGLPLRPEYVLRHFHQLSAAAALPQIRVHDLRHLAATLMISLQVPLAVVSKTLRHSKLSITVDTYGHLIPHAAQQAVTPSRTPSQQQSGPSLSMLPKCDHTATTRQQAAAERRELMCTAGSAIKGDLRQPGDPRSSDEEWS